MAGLQVADLAAMRVKVRDWADTAVVSDSVIDDFINMAVGKLAGIVRVRAMEKDVILPITGDAVDIPADYEQTKYLKVTSNGCDYHLERKPISVIDEYGSRQDGVPRFFGRDLTKFRMAPFPIAITEAELSYYIQPPALTSDLDTNWFITDASEAVLFGSLWRLGLYTHDTDFAEDYKAQFVEEAVEVQAIEDKAEWSGDTLAITL